MNAITREQALVLLTAALLLEDGDAVRKSVIDLKGAGGSNQDVEMVFEILLGIRRHRLEILKGGSCSKGQQGNVCCC